MFSTQQVDRQSGARRWMRWLMVLAVLLGPVCYLNAQKSEDRQPVRKVAPKYPEDLKRHDIGGVVRLSVEISPRGTVSKISPIGGNPILVESAIEAVKQWKYAPAETTQTIEVKIDFIPRQ